MIARAPVSVRATGEADVPGLLALLNAIVRVGGTTAIETPIDAATFAGWFVDGPHCLACTTAAGRDGAPLGFQSLGTAPTLPPGCGDIATFVRLGETGRGIGGALFERTSALARARGLSALNATIRSDNAGGLAFYSRLGFVDHAVARGVPLRDGTPLDRVSKRYALS